MPKLMLPLSGDVNQVINPWNWMTQSIGGQFGRPVLDGGDRFGRRIQLVEQFGQLVRDPLGRRDDQVCLAGGPRAHAPVEGGAPRRQCLGMGPRHDVMDGDDEGGAPPDRRHEEGRCVDDVAAGSQRRRQSSLPQARQRRTGQAERVHRAGDLVHGWARAADDGADVEVIVEAGAGADAGGGARGPAHGARGAEAPQELRGIPSGAAGHSGAQLLREEVDLHGWPFCRLYGVPRTLPARVEPGGRAWG